MITFCFQVRGKCVEFGSVKMDQSFIRGPHDLASFSCWFLPCSCDRFSAEESGTNVNETKLFPGFPLPSTSRIAQKQVAKLVTVPHKPKFSFTTQQWSKAPRSAKKTRVDPVSPGLTARAFRAEPSEAPGADGPGPAAAPGDQHLQEPPDRAGGGGGGEAAGGGGGESELVYSRLTGGGGGKGGRGDRGWGEPTTSGLLRGCNRPPTTMELDEPGNRLWKTEHVPLKGTGSQCSPKPAEDWRILVGGLQLEKSPWFQEALSWLVGTFCGFEE